MHSRQPFYAFVVSKGTRAAGTVAAGLAAGVVLFAAGAGVASTPGASSVTVPTGAGQTVTSEWTGIILPGVNPSSSCSGFPGAPAERRRYPDRRR